MYLVLCAYGGSAASQIGSMVNGPPEGDLQLSLMQYPVAANVRCITPPEQKEWPDISGGKWEWSLLINQEQEGGKPFLQSQSKGKKGKSESQTVK